LPIYNTKSGTWFNITTSGIIPESRVGHTATLVPDGRIIVYGGIHMIGEAYLPPKEDLIVLNTSRPIYDWKVPQIQKMPASRSTDELHILDISNEAEYKWVTTMDKPVYHQNDQIQEYHNDFQTPALTISSQEYKLVPDRLIG
ncbi:2544_t:CDS:2, partial [Funneliformis mosseae]